MAVGEGKFRLYKKITPDLTAGDWQISADHELTAAKNTTSLGASTLPVERSDVHFHVTSPRYVLPPEQVLSTFPPANSIGQYGSRLPQVVIKRRTLPWERLVDDGRPDTPWMALVVIAEGEAELETNVAVARCFTLGTQMPAGGSLDDPEVETANCLVVRKSVVDRVFPTQNDVDLLAHAREVDINDTELMMGDDDGYLSVVVANRLPVPGIDAAGDDTPVKYLACLVNLEGQFNRLLPVSPDPEPNFATPWMSVVKYTVTQAAVDDHMIMDTAEPPPAVKHQIGLTVDNGDDLAAGAPLAAASDGPVTASPTAAVAASGAGQGYLGGTAWNAAVETNSNVYTRMARDFRITHPSATFEPLDQELRFPVMLHWSFTTFGDDTFKSLMQGLDSRLLGDTSAASATLAGRLPLEVTETGHVGLNHRTREGDTVRSWYRGPLAPHPTKNTVADRLPLAHSSDQLRIVIPDGREDISLAGAFEIGRLLALSQPSIVASLLRWRQGQFHAARRQVVLQLAAELWDNLGITAEMRGQLGDLGEGVAGFDEVLGRRLVSAMVQEPATFIGAPRELVSPGRNLDIEGVPSDLLAVGLGIEASVFRGRAEVVFDRLIDIESPAIDIVLDKIGTVAVRDTLHVTLDNVIAGLAVDALAPELDFDRRAGPAFGPTGFGTGGGTDGLDLFLAEEPDDRIDDGTES